MTLKQVRFIAHKRVFTFITIGEIFLMTCVLAFTAWWFWFWRFGYYRINNVNEKKYDVIVSWARAMGHMANLMFVFLLFPVTRNSMWGYLYGISYERALWYHRWIGFFALVATTIHLLLWLILWGKFNVLLYNIWTPTNFSHPDNFTPTMMELIWIGMVIMISLAYERFRRKHYELFYYTHHFFVVIFAGALVHSWALWYFLGGPLALWFVDRLIRFSRGTQQMRVVSLRDFNMDHVRLEIEPINRRFAYKAGQFSWINVPAISALEWHPFTLSSSPNQNNFTFHIKDMGVNTWTQQLVRLSHVKSAQQETLVVNVDGPYGHPPDVMDFDAIVLISGGIGVTPCHSILQDLHQKSVFKNENIPSVYFYWTVRDPEILLMFESTFKALAVNNPTNKFSVNLYATQGKDRKISLPYFSSRPDVETEMVKVKMVHGKSVLVFVCGPKPMVDDAKNISFRLGFHFHEETFEF